MKAFVLSQYKEPLQQQDVPDPCSETTMFWWRFTRQA